MSKVFNWPFTKPFHKTATVQFCISNCNYSQKACQASIRSLYTETVCFWHVGDILQTRFSRTRHSLWELARQTLNFWLEIIGIINVVTNFFVNSGILLQILCTFKLKGVFCSSFDTYAENELIKCPFHQPSWTSCYNGELWRSFIKYITTKGIIGVALEAKRNGFKKLLIMQIHHVYMYFTTKYNLIAMTYF